MHRTLAVALALAALACPLPAWAQEAGTAHAAGPLLSASAPVAALAGDLPGPAAWLTLPPAPGEPERSRWYSAVGAAKFDRAQARAARSLSRHVVLGAGIGAAAGVALGLWVISIADCGGPDCTAERVLGVAGNALGGAAIGALLGAAVYLVRR